jgi:hypothetical protein
LIDYQEMIDLWGVDGLLHFPLDRLGTHLGFDPLRLPPEGAMPAEVPILFTAYLEGDIDLFDVLEIQVGDDEPMGLIVLGTVPDDEQMLYCLDGDDGRVLLVSLDPFSMEQVNSSFALFVEFLWRLDRFLRDDQGGAGRAVVAAALRHELTALDPAAFADPESWWSIAFGQLEGSLR